jgi:hypothetical protein
LIPMHGRPLLYWLQVAFLMDPKKLKCLFWQCGLGQKQELSLCDGLDLLDTSKVCSPYLLRTQN